MVKICSRAESGVPVVMIRLLRPPLLIPNNELLPSFSETLAVDVAINRSDNLRRSPGAVFCWDLLRLVQLSAQRIYRPTELTTSGFDVPPAWTRNGSRRWHWGNPIIPTLTFKINSH
jgi:hypothetical protein